MAAIEITPIAGSHRRSRNPAVGCPLIKGIIGYLFQHQVRPELTCRFSKEPGSSAFRDNRAAQHNPFNDYQGYRRVMRRITQVEDKPC